MDLGTRVYICEYCGLMIDRRLECRRQFGTIDYRSSPERYACGENVSPGYQAVLVESGTEQQYTNAFV